LTETTREVDEQVASSKVGVQSRKTVVDHCCGSHAAAQIFRGREVERVAGNSVHTSDLGGLSCYRHAGLLQAHGNGTRQNNGGLSGSCSNDCQSSQSNKGFFH